MAVFGALQQGNTHNLEVAGSKPAPGTNIALNVDGARRGPGWPSRTSLQRRSSGSWQSSWPRRRR
ncbi:hypothetical protein IBTHAUMO2_450042 [Nitrosopumilaceae archaeon]|nr:hypothetical protein IBTHAUMO2_450042 [Nitrosopumilaceae archaeon]